MLKLGPEHGKICEPPHVSIASAATVRGLLVPRRAGRLEASHSLLQRFQQWCITQINDIIRGTFKGFALLRQATGQGSRASQPVASRPVYAPGYGLIPPSQVRLRWRHFTSSRPTHTASLSRNLGTPARESRTGPMEEINPAGHALAPSCKLYSKI